jgi:hypothetical protein
MVAVQGSDYGPPLIHSLDVVHVNILTSIHWVTYETGPLKIQFGIQCMRGN